MVGTKDYKQSIESIISAHDQRGKPLRLNRDIGLNKRGKNAHVGDKHHNTALKSQYVAWKKKKKSLLN